VANSDIDLARGRSVDGASAPASRTAPTVQLITFDGTTTRPLAPPASPPAWWSQFEAELTEARFHRPKHGHALIQVDGATIGYCRWRGLGSPLLTFRELVGVPEGSLEVDLLIWTDPPATNVFRRIVRSVALMLFTDRTIPAICVVVSASNTDTARLLEDSGVACAGPFEDPRWGPCVCFVAVRPR
jgi:hypothetical protein